MTKNYNNVTKEFKVPLSKILYPIYDTDGLIEGYRALFADGTEEDVYVEKL